MGISDASFTRASDAFGFVGVVDASNGVLGGFGCVCCSWVPRIFRSLVVVFHGCLGCFG